MNELRGMKERELRQVAECGICGKKVGASGVPLFYRLHIERWGIKADAVSRQSGLEQVLGGAVRLAQAMGPDEDLAVQVVDPISLTVCETCANEKQVYVGAIACRE